MCQCCQNCKKKNNSKELVAVFDTVSELVFSFKSHEDKEEFFNAWDKYVVKVER